MPTDSPDPHLEHGHVAAVFAERDAAEAAVEELRKHGFGSEHLGIAVHDENPVDFEQDAESRMFYDTAVGVATGAPLGALAGLAIAAIAATGVGAIGIGGIFALGAATGLMGGVLGGYLGTAEGFVEWEEHEEFGFVALDPGEVLIVVCSHGEPDAVRRLLNENGGRLISKATTQP